MSAAQWRRAMRSSGGVPAALAAPLALARPAPATIAQVPQEIGRAHV